MQEELIALQMTGVRKSFTGSIALDGVDFELRRGEVHVLLGENGAGKSTLMKILSGAYQKDSGTILLNGAEIEIRSPRHAAEVGIAIIYQEFNLVPQLSVAENIFLGREPTRGAGFIKRAEIRKAAAEILKSLGLGIDPDTAVRQLGIAGQQMVEVAKAISLNARILIMDEPTSALTDREIQELFARIRALKQEGVSIIYISHRLEEVLEIGDRVTVLRDGKHIGTRDLARVTKPELIRMMADRELTEQFPKVSARLGDDVLRVSGLYSGGFLKDVNFTLRRGEILGVAGLLGSGRTRLARAIFGVDPIQSGEIRVKGIPRKSGSPRIAIKSGMGFLTEDRRKEGLVLNLPVKENISLPNLDRLSRFGFLDQKAVATAARRYVRELRIKTSGIDQHVMYLSGGNQQKVVLSKWLFRNTEILILDEPTRGIDVGAKAEIYELMNQLTADGVAILMISSELPEILGMSDRILVMHKGRIRAEVARGQAAAEDLLQSALGQ